LTALKSGDVDFNPRMTPIQFAQQTSGQQFDSQFRKTSYSIPQFVHSGWNMERPQFKDKRVRQALTMLVNRAQIVETVRFGLATLTESPISSYSPEHNPNLKPYPFDPKRARQLLDEAGWKDSDGDGIRDKDGMPFRFEMMITTSNPIGNQLLAVFKQQFRQAGIEMTERRLESTVFLETVADHQFDAESSSWTSGLFTDPYELWHSHSAQNRGSNFVSFKNPEADALIEQASLQFDPEKRRQILWKLQEIIREEQPYTFLWINKEAAAWDKRFQNVVWFPLRPGYDLSTWVCANCFSTIWRSESELRCLVRTAGSRRLVLVAPCTEERCRSPFVSNYSSEECVSRPAG
jgi:peptide/nickel transport system substrate-binding protein